MYVVLKELVGGWLFELLMLPLGSGRSSLSSLDFLYVRIRLFSLGAGFLSVVAAGYCFRCVCLPFRVALSCAGRAVTSARYLIVVAAVAHVKNGAPLLLLLLPLSDSGR